MIDHSIRLGVNTRCARLCENPCMRLVILVLGLWPIFSVAQAQPAADADVVAKALFPKDDELPHWRLREIAERMNLRAGSQVADVGCGGGQIAVVWSRVVGPAGHVWAEDIDPRALRGARRLMKAQHARNVTVLQGDAADPRLPAGKLDAISLLFVYHELVKYPEMLARFRAALKPDGRLIILDPTARKTASRPRQAQTRNHVLRPDLAQEEVRSAGFEVLSRDDHFVDDPDFGRDSMADRRQANR
jgi:precorrin-6B methylase 2